MNKSVTIIIPNYNKSKYLVECFNSAVEQTYEHKEIIFIDDCSSDNSLEIAYTYQNKYNFFKVIALKENKGVSNARNIGVENSTSDYVVFLDLDDLYINKEKLENEMKLADTYSVAFSQYIPLTETGQQISTPVVKENPYSSKYAVVDFMLITKKAEEQLRGYIISKQLFNEVGGYNISLNLYEDLDLQCRLALKAKFAYTGSIGEGYRTNTGGLSCTDYEKHQIALKNIRRKYYKKLSFGGKIYYFCKKNYLKKVLRKIKLFFKKLFKA